MKKKITPKNTLPPSGVERHTVGSDLTAFEKIRIPLSPDTIPIIEEFFRRDFTFSGSINIFEKRAVQILQDAGLPTDPNVFYSIPDGIPAKSSEGRIPAGTGTLDALVKARGYKERADKGWYAAEILSRAARLRKILSRIKVDSEAARNEADALAFFACDLGLLVYEAIGFKFPYEADALRGIASLKGSESPKPPRRILELEKYMHFRRKNEDLTFKEFKEKVVNTEGGDPLEWRNFQFWFEEGRVYVQENTEGDEKKARSVSIESLARYWNRPPTRTK